MSKNEKTFNDIMNDIENFLNTEIEDTHDFFMDIEFELMDGNRRLSNEEPTAFSILFKGFMPISEDSEPGMSTEEMQKMKKSLEEIYLKAKQVMR